MSVNLGRWLHYQQTITHTQLLLLSLVTPVGWMTNWPARAFPSSSRVESTRRAGRAQQLNLLTTRMVMLSLFDGGHDNNWVVSPATIVRYYAVVCCVIRLAEGAHSLQQSSRRKNKRLLSCSRTRTKCAQVFLLLCINERSDTH